MVSKDLDQEMTKMFEATPTPNQPHLTVPAKCSPNELRMPVKAFRREMWHT
jgi:hypothetical protein